MEIKVGQVYESGYGGNRRITKVTDRFVFVDYEYPDDPGLNKSTKQLRSDTATLIRANKWTLLYHPCSAWDVSEGL